MPRLTANPNAEANLAFDVVKPGTYRMRVKEIVEFTAQSGNTCWRARLEYAEPVDRIDGQPAQNPGTVLDNSLVAAPADKQGKLRSFVEACGIGWSDLDSDQLVGCELVAKIDIEEYNGEQRNTVRRYMKP